MNEKRSSLYLTVTGEMGRTQALLAFVARQSGAAGMIFDLIDAAERAGIEQARDLSDAIRFAAKDVR